ncbi:MAG: hypothetical protein ACFFB2_08875 [Promethearchaeota archaeon]
MSNLSRSELWQFSKKIHEEIYFQTQLATGISTKVETIEKYEKNLKSQRRLTLLGGLFICYILGVVTILPAIGILQLVSIDITSINFDVVVFTFSLILSVYNLYILFILFMASLMNYVTFMRGDYFRLLRSLPLSSHDMIQLTLFVFFRMNAIQLIFILFALPIVGFILTLSPLSFFILLLNNLINLGFIVPVLVIIAWVLAQKVFNNAEKSAVGPIITVLTIVVYILTVIPIFFLMSSLYHIINILFNSSLITGEFTPEINFILTLIPFPFSSSYLTTILLLLPPSSLSLSLILSSSSGVFVLLGIITIAFRKGSSLIQKLAFEPSVDSYKVISEKDISIQLKTSHPVFTFMKKNLKMVFRDYGALTLFVCGLLIPSILFMYSITMPKRYIDSSGGQSWFILSMLLLMPGFLIFMFFNSLRLSERNLGGLLSTLPFEEKDLFRSKQIIITIGCLLPVLFIFLILQDFMTINMYYASIKIFFANIIAVYIFLILYAFFFGKINNRYTFTTENTENQILKWIIIMVGLNGCILCYVKLTEIVSESFLHIFKFCFILLISLIFIIILEFITKWIFPQEPLVKSVKGIKPS